MFAWHPAIKKASSYLILFEGWAKFGGTKMMSRPKTLS